MPASETGEKSENQRLSSAASNLEEFEIAEVANVLDVSVGAINTDDKRGRPPAGSHPSNSQHKPPNNHPSNSQHKPPNRPIPKPNHPIQRPNQHPPRPGHHWPHKPNKPNIPNIDPSLILPGQLPSSPVPGSSGPPGAASPPTSAFECGKPLVTVQNGQSTRFGDEFSSDFYSAPFGDDKFDDEGFDDDSSSFGWDPPTSVQNGPGFLQDATFNPDDTFQDIFDFDTVASPGEITQIENWPWQVSLRFGDHHICGGCLIGNSWVVTVAHCFENSTMGSDYSVHLGKSKLGEHETGESIRHVKAITIHPGYDKKKGFDNDIALIELREVVTYSARMLPACLPRKGSQVQHGRECWISGYGSATDGNGLLKIVNTKHIALETCRSLGDQAKSALTDQMICAEIIVGGISDLCQQGELGAPLVIRGHKSNQYVLFGLASFGVQCSSEKKAGAYVRMASYFDWIVSTSKISA